MPSTRNDTRSVSSNSCICEQNLELKFHTDENFRYLACVAVIKNREMLALQSSESRSTRKHQDVMEQKMETLVISQGEAVESSAQRSAEILEAVEYLTRRQEECQKVMEDSLKKANRPPTIGADGSAHENAEVLEAIKRIEGQLTQLNNLEAFNTFTEITLSGRKVDPRAEQILQSSSFQKRVLSESDRAIEILKDKGASFIMPMAVLAAIFCHLLTTALSFATKLPLQLGITRETEEQLYNSILLLDAMGRKRPIPLQMGRTFDQFRRSIQIYFENESFYHKVARMEYRILDPTHPILMNGFESEKDWQIRRPGVPLEMSMELSVDPKLIQNICPQCAWEQPHGPMFIENGCFDW